ncbi:hypothetical protein [Neisseria sp. Ec49-e6-T10]|uniref:hypothetical protein n=1 Tax=Neisseria sp. Ec49-e6-T10 TaxID=3140744 RepID=UPI003EBD67C4
MIDTDKVKRLINERQQLLPDDPRTDEIWEELTRIFSKSEDDTIYFIRNCDENELEWISEVFEDVSKNLQSHEFIQVLEQLNNKYPHLKLEMDINFAKKAIKDHDT